MELDICDEFCSTCLYIFFLRFITSDKTSKNQKFIDLLERENEV